MTQDIALDQGWAPSACTLPTAEQPLRVSEFDALFTDAVQGVARPERTRLRLDLAFSPGNAARAAELTARENGCCSFFTFTLTIADGSLALEVAVPPEQVEVLDALQARTGGRPAQQPVPRPHAELGEAIVMDRISREDLASLLEAGTVQLVEALPADAFAAEHIPGARNVPGQVSAELAEQVAPDRAATVVVYCSGPYCNRSRVAAAAFVRLGYADVRVYTGGKQDWAEAGLTFEGSRVPTSAAGVGRST